MNAPIGEELQALALTLAYEHASGIIESYCVPVSFEVGEPGWYEIPALELVSFYSNARMLEIIDDCVRFLEMRGLLVRHESRPDWVSILDESEAAQ